MNWPAPNVLPPPGPAEVDAPAEVVAPAVRAERRRLSAVPAAAWLALLGAALVLAAAVAVVASNWSAIGSGFRVAGLALVTVGLLVGAERLRGVAPTSAGVIAHAGTSLTTSVAIAVLSLAGFTWPACILAGGATLVMTTAWQAGRWRRATMHLAQVVGLALVATGSAALLSTSAGLVAMLLAVCLLVAGAQRRSVALAIAAVLSPALTMVAAQGVGAGTLERAGLIGEPLGWSGPLVGLLAATVVGAVGAHRRNNSLVMIAAASPIIGIVTGFAASDAGAVAWWCVPALALIAAELGVRLRPNRSSSATTDELLDLAAGAVATGLWLSPLLVGLASWSGQNDAVAALPVAVTCLGVALSALRWHERGSRLIDGALAALAAGVIAVPIAFELHETVVAVASVAAFVTATVFSRRLSPVAIYGAAGWALLAVGSAADPRSLLTTGLTALLLGALAAVTVLARARLAAANGWLGWVEMTLLTWATAVAATALWDGHEPAIALATVALIAMGVVLADGRHRAWSIAAIGLTGTIGFDAASATGTLDTSYALGWWVVVGVLAAMWALDRSPIWSYAATGAAVIAATASTAWFELSAADVSVLAMLATVALTGLAWTLGRSPLDAAAIAAGVVLAITTTLPVDPEWASVAWVVIGLQIVVIGLAIDRRVVAWLGSAVSTAGLIGWWETSGLHDWFIGSLAPLDITIDDLWSAALSLAALVAGIVVRRSFVVNSWAAYGAALVIPGLWLTVAQIERDPGWALPLLIGVGVGAAIAGGWGRLAAPLVGGTCLTVTGLVLAIEADLTAVPTWTWLAIGGGALLGTAVLIERAGRPGSADLRELIARWD